MELSRIASCFATGTFAMGDARYTARLKLPVINPETSAAWTGPEVEAIFSALKPFSGALLLSVSMGVYYDITTPIPDADAKYEHRAKILVRGADDSVAQLEIPMCEPDEALTPSTILAALVAAKFVTFTGAAPVAIIQINRSPERRARGR